MASALTDITYIKDYLPAKDDKSKPEPITETVQAGIELNVTSEIMARSTCTNQEQIMLDVNMVSTEVETKKVNYKGNIIDLPVIDSAHIITKVAIDDGQTIVIGGTKGMKGYGNSAYHKKKKQLERVILLKARKID